MIRFNELEHWSRRIINDKYIEKYEADYFDYKFESGFFGPVRI